MKFKIFPHKKFIVEKRYANTIVNALSLSRIKYSARIKNEFLEICVSIKNANDVEKIFKSKSVEILNAKAYGLFVFFEKFKRVGLILGVLLILFSVYLSSKFVWRIEIYGNEDLSEEDVIEMLGNSGFFCGKFIPNIDYDKLHNEILLKNEEISWVSINLDGSVATVLIKETKSTNLESDYYSNVVAKCDAQIVEIRVKNGEKVIKINDVVKEGELLISGIIDSQSLGVRYEKASGEVFARTTNEISVIFPYKGKEKVYTGRSNNRYKLKIFSKEINFSRKNNKNLELCDKIEKSRQIVLFGKYELPIFIETVKYTEYVLKEKMYSKEEAVDLAFTQLKNELDALLNNAELISRSVETSFDENGFYIA